MNPRTWADVRKLKDLQDRPLLGDFANETTPRIYGVPVYLTTQLSITETQGAATNASSIYCYSTDGDVGPALVRRMDAEVEMDRSRLFDRDMSEMRGKLRVDLLVPQPSAVVRIVGVIPAA